MLVAATFFSTQLSQLKKRWHFENKLEAKHVGPVSWKKEEFQETAPGEIGPVLKSNCDYAGHMVVFDWSTGEVVWKSKWKPVIVVPAGFCFADDAIYVNDSESAGLYEIDIQKDFGAVTRRISHPYFNDLHSLERTKRGFLVTSSGTDSILEISPEGELLYEWWSVDHGYSMTPSGQARESGRGLDHRGMFYHTRFHSTHVNSATIRDEQERFILALLFHQGMLVEIDRSLPVAEQRPRVVLDKLVRPHALERTPLGWLFCNSLGKELILLGFDLKERRRIPYDGQWIQDCTMLSSGNIVLGDVNEHRIVELEGPNWKVSRTIEYDPEWRLAELNEIPAVYAQNMPAGVYA